MLPRGPFPGCDAEAALGQVRDLMAIDPDPAMRARIGDLIVSSTRHGGPLPDVATVRRKIGAGLDPASPDITTGEWLGKLAGGQGQTQSRRRLGDLIRQLGCNVAQSANDGLAREAQRALDVPALLAEAHQFGCRIGRLSQICQRSSTPLVTDPRPRRECGRPET